MNKAIGIGIGIAVVAIAVVFAYSYSLPESEIQEQNVVIQDEATSNVEIQVTPPGKSISLKAEDSVGLEDKP